MSTLEGQVRTPVTSRSTPINIVKRTNHGVNIGDRVKANSYSGIVRFIGTTQFKTGTWAGIELDIAGTGKNDGSVEGKRYFVCPQKTGIFIPLAKVTKFPVRPSTPFIKTSKSSLLSSSSSTSPIFKASCDIPIPPLPKRQDIESKLPKLQKLEIENKQLKSQQQTCQQQLDALKTQLDKERSHSQNLKLQISTLNGTVNELKQTSLESLDMLESISVSHQKEMISLRDTLALEKKRVSDLLQEQDELRTVSQEAIDSYEATITSMEGSSKTYQNISDLERRRLQQDQTLEVNQLAHKLDAATSEITQQKTLMDKLELAQGAVERRHQHEIKIFLQDINVLESVIQGKMDKENDLLNLLKVERKLTTRLKTELKVSRLQTKFNHYQDKPATPIEDDEDDSVCAICNGKHDIIHCALTV